MEKVQLSSRLVRKIILNSQLLDGGTKIAKGKKGITQIVEKLGYIQIDTISVIKRSHHTALWTRSNYYNEDMLHALQAKDRKVFEYWSHAMSYLPMSDFRYALPKMRNFNNPKHQWFQSILNKHKHLLKPVMERIRAEGPLSSKDFSSSGKKGGTWWDWKPAKMALELLFWRGDLMIAKRNKFQKIYDLTERVIPNSIDTTIPNNEEAGQFIVGRPLSAFGIAEQKEIQKYMQPDTLRDADLQLASREVISKALKDLLEDNEVIPVIIEGNNNSTYYALNGTIKKFMKNEQSSSQVFLLSPFDNLIIQRERTRRLFDFDYALECYLPAQKRKYGYFVMPIIWGENFIGRLDPKADAKTKTFIVRNLEFEPSLKSFEELLPLLGNKLVALAKFNNCDKIKLEKTKPNKIKTVLNKLVKNNF